MNMARVDVIFSPWAAEKHFIIYMLRIDVLPIANTSTTCANVKTQVESPLRIEFDENLIQG